MIPVAQELSLGWLNKAIKRATEELEAAGSAHRDFTNHYERIGGARFYLSQAAEELQKLTELLKEKSK